MKNLIYFICIFLVFGCKQDVDFEDISVIDLEISDVLLIDGTGKDAFRTNIYIHQDSIIYIGTNLDNSIQINRRISGNGSYISPGFIDLHAHGNPQKTPDFRNFLAMGVTTIVLGQDGSSPLIENMQDWFSMPQSDSLGLNIAMFIGHGTLRRLAGIGNHPSGTVEQQLKMYELLDKNLDFCYGLSTGLEYTPGIFAHEEELIQLSRIVGAKDRMIMSHLRNEDDDALEDSIDELLRQGEYAKVHIAHLKSVYGRGENRANEILEKIHTARAKGINVSADMYPYFASYTGIGIVFPEWAKTQEDFEYAKLNKRAELELFIRNKVFLRNGPDATLLGTEPYIGLTLKDLELRENKSFENILIDDIGPNGASGAYFVMDAELQSRMLSDSIIGICSDGSPTGFHPRGHGTFAKMIEQFVLQDSLLSLPEAIRKMTSYPASLLNLQKRGVLKAGMKADIIVFKPENIKANATYENPFQLSSGFEYVLVNGKIVWENEQLTGNRSGTFLLPN